MNLLIVPNKDRIERTGIAISSKPDQVSQRFPDPLDGKPHHRLQRGTDLRGGGVERVGSFPVAQTRSVTENSVVAHVPSTCPRLAGVTSPSRVSVRPASPLFATLKANQQRLSTALSTLANLFGWVALLALAFGYVAFIDLMVN